MTQHIAALAVLLLCFIASDVWAQDFSSWPRFNRNNQNTAFSPYSLAIISAPAYKWESELPLEIVGAVLGQNESLIYTSSMYPLFSVSAVETSEGNRIWQVIFAEAIGSPPTFHFSLRLQTALILVTHGSNLTALAADTGRVVWTAGKPMFLIGTEFSGAPLVGDHGDIYCVTSSPHGRVYAMNSTDGSLLWTKFIDNTGLYKSSAMSRDGVLLYVPSANTMYAINVQTQEVAWSVPFSADKLTSPSLLYLDPSLTSSSLLLVGNNDVFYAIDASTGAPLWNYTLGGPMDDDAIAAVNEETSMIYVPCVDHNLYALNETGYLQWQYPLDSPAYSPTVDGQGRILCPSNDMKVTTLNPDGSKLWAATMPGQTLIMLSAPIIDHNGNVYVCAFEYLIALTAETQTTIWRVLVILLIVGGGIAVIVAIAVCICQCVRRLNYGDIVIANDELSNSSDEEEIAILSETRRRINDSD